MNNEQFRRLVAASTENRLKDKNDSSPPPPPSSRPAALGSRFKSSIPMTPRAVAGGARLDFARQLADKNRPSENTTKKARTSTPKGIKLAAGYVDRAKQRREQEERMKELEEAFKNEEIDQETYDRQRGEIMGIDLSSTFLAKGQVQKQDGTNGEEEEAQPEEEEDPDDILEQLESAQVKAIEREKVQKKGQVATTTLNPGQKRTRSQIIAELKAAREAAKAKQESSLGSRFKKINAKPTPGTRIERDSKGREVMIIVDEDGHERRKVRKLDPKVQEEQEREAAALAALAQSKVLGMEVPEFYRKQQEEAAAAAAQEEEKEITIFDDVESDYDPLAGLEDSDSSDSSEDEGEVKDKEQDKDKAAASSTDMSMLPPPVPKLDAPAATRNYFKDSKTGLTSQETYKAPSLNDPSFVAALKKAKAISAAEKSEEEQREAERQARLRKKLEESSRDDADMDLGFGSSRVDDEADMQETKVKISEWRGGEGHDDYDDDGGDGEGGGGGKPKRKRGAKKRKGDKNSFSDVMAVMERNKKQD